MFTVQLTAPEAPASTNRSPCRTRSLWFWRFSAHVRPVLREQWEDHYNYDRPHGALAGQTPYERLKQKARDPLS